MSDTLSNTAIIYAILSLNSEITLQKEYLDSIDDTEASKKDEKEILEDLEQAFSEFIGLYKKRCKTERKLPLIEDLLNNPV